VNEEARAFFQKYLRAHAAAHVEQLVGFLGNPAVEIAAGVAEILEAVDDPRAKEAIAALSAHESAQMRKLGLHAAGRGRGSKGAFYKALRDPEGEIRLVALKLIIQKRERAMAETLKSLVDASSFARRPKDEQALFHAAFASVGGVAAEHFYIKHAEPPKKGWFARAKNDAEVTRRRIRAYMALALINTPGAKAALRAGAADDDPVVKSACTSLMNNPQKLLEEVRPLL
jgi:hypothetical protein